MPDGFGWISFIDTLAGGDITKYEAIYDMNYEQCMYKLLYMYHCDKVTREINKRQALQNKIK